MDQNVNNADNSIDNQLNVNQNTGIIHLGNKTRLSKRFEKLNTEIASDIRYEGVMEALEHYLTKLDGVDMPTKLADGGFTQEEIIKAQKRKEKYAKKAEKNRFFESAQLIDSELFAKIRMDFETYVEPLINAQSGKDAVRVAVRERVVQPILDMVNTDGEHDEVLRYDTDDVLGMIYFLTGKCHLNWKNYDNI
jgi:hypothetical protein